MPAFPASQHTLANGLTLYLSPNPAEPRVYTQICVRAGSKHDPDQSTGLAHYLEHMLFKGTDKIGSRDWEAEEPLLREIAETYEAHRKTSDAGERRTLYKKIDDLSQRAAGYALPGEYDRVIAQLGAQGTNAYTWVDQTVFLNDIPSNELGRWMALETERFSRLVLRLFHTELETVFEEFNITQDSDGRKAMRAANAALFPTHPYGTHTTIGRGEHLKAPSHFDIYDFFARHYVPANMAVVIAGDFDEAEAFELATKTFGAWAPRPVPAYEPAPLGTPRASVSEVFGEEAASVQLNWRTPAADSREALVTILAAGMLYNRQAGLFDLHLIQPQRVLKASAGIIPMAESGVLRASVQPLPGQTLEAARELALAQVAALAEGRAPKWLREAVLVDHELTQTRTAESNRGRAAQLSNAFLHHVPLSEALDVVARLRTVTDAEVAAFAKTYLAPEACVTVYKRQGPDAAVMKVDKPDITPVPLNTTEVSGFAERLLTSPPDDIAPEFADLDALITVRQLDDRRELHHLANEENGLCELLYVYDFGSRDEPWAKLATKYLEYLGTDRRTQAEFEIALYRYGLEWQVQITAKRLYVGVSGLDKHLRAGLDLLDELLHGAQPDEAALARLIDNIAQKRRNEQSDKQMVLRKGLNNYGRFREDSPILARPTAEAMRAKSAAELVALIRELPRRPHQVFYYGPREVADVRAVLTRRGAGATNLGPVPEAAPLRMAVPDRDRVVLTHFPQVQVEVLALRHVGSGFAERRYVLSEWFNQYYGMGLSAVVFQELRESRALAYSTYAYAESPKLLEGDHLLQAFIGTQPDKLETALTAMRDLLSDWRFDAEAAERVRQGILQQMRSGRDLRQSRYWLWRQAQDRGLKGNPRQRMYDGLQAAKPADLLAFFEELDAAPTTFLVLGDVERIDRSVLEAIGEVEQKTVGDVFGG